MPPTIPTELAEARRARELAWNEYQQVLDAPHTHAEFTAALDKACAADREAVSLYNRWQAVGGTSNITSIVAAEIERENAAINDWLQADDAAALYGDADPRTPAQRAADEDWQDEQNTREAVRPGY